jgi:uncharacterized membrane protein
MARLEQTIEIDAPADAVWKVLGDFGNVAHWAPSVRRSRLNGDLTQGVGAERVLRHVWGFRLVETVTAWNEAHDFSYGAHLPFPMTTLDEKWSMNRTNEGSTAVTTRVEYGTRLGGFGKLLEGLLLNRIVRKNMSDGLAGLKRAAESR